MKKHSVKNLFTRCFIFALITFILSATLVVSAAGYESDTAYNSYTYWQDSYVNKPVPTKAAFSVDTVVDAGTLGLTGFTEIADMSVGPDGSIYLVDTTEAKVTVISSEYKLSHQITSFNNNGEVLKLKKPRGIFVSPENVMYICDTDNARIIVSDTQGNVSDIITVPDSSLMPDDFTFRPIRVTVDQSGYTYVLSDGCYYGAILYNPDGKFIGFYGANEAEASFLSALANLWENLTMTSEKYDYSVKSLPYQLVDLYVDNEGFVYTATGSTTNNNRVNAIRRLSPIGTNILKGEKPFGEDQITRNSLGRTVKPDISGVCVDNQGFLYCYDSSLGNIYMYDNSCNFVSAFGGGVGNGTQAGTFKKPCGIDYYNDRLYVCDQLKQSVTIFKFTEYGQLLRTAQQYSNDGDYDKAEELWENILAQDKNCQLAYIGLGRAAFNRADYEAAIEYSKKGLDRDTYGRAYEQLRGDLLSKNFGFIFVGCVLLVAALWVGLVYKKKKGIVFIKNYDLRLALTVPIHPANNFGEIREKKKGSVIYATIILVVYYISEILKNDFYGFTFSSTDATAFNSIVVLIRSLGAVLIWTVVNWAVCTLFNGLGKIKEIYIVTCYSLIVLIISNVVTTVLSNFLLESEASFLSIIGTVAVIYTVLLLAIGLMKIHDYTFGKFVGTSILSIFGLLLVVFLIAVTIIMVQQIFTFVGTVFLEVAFR